MKALLPLLVFTLTLSILSCTRSGTSSNEQLNPLPSMVSLSAPDTGTVDLGEIDTPETQEPSLKCDEELTKDHVAALTQGSWSGSFYRLGTRQPIRVGLKFQSTSLVMETWPDHLEEVKIHYQGSLPPSSGVFAPFLLTDRENSKNILKVKPYFCPQGGVFILKDAEPSGIRPDARQILLKRAS